MSINVQKKDLLEAMQKAYPIVPSKSSLMILCNFRITYADSILEISATDVDHSLRVGVGASGDGDIDIAVNAKKVFDVVRELPEGAVTIDVDGMVLLIESEKGFSCKISGADPSDFPGVPSMEGVGFSVDAPTLRGIISKSSFAVAKDESRGSLSGVLWELRSDKMGMVSTDGHRLGYSFIDMDLPVGENVSRIVSQKGVSTLTRITDTDNADEILKVIVGEKYVSFSAPSFTMVSKLIDGQYPEYGKVIPKNNPRVVIADRVSMFDAVRRVSVMSNSKTNLVKLIFRNGEMEATVVNKEIGGEARESIAVEYDGEEHIVGFNGKFFTEILDKIGTEKVRLEMNTQISACVIYPVYADEKDKVSEDLFLIMPLRILDEI
ncbi:DNA polymerase III subunit beta [Fibrobacteres bacterium R8-0-B4]